MEHRQIQLDFFVQETPISRVTQRIESLATTMDKVRKSLFASQTDLSKSFLSQQLELDRLSFEMRELKRTSKELEQKINVFGARTTKDSDKRSNCARIRGETKKRGILELAESDD